MFVSVYTVLSFFLLVFGLLAFGMAGNCECILDVMHGNKGFRWCVSFLRPLKSFQGEGERWVKKQQNPKYPRSLKITKGKTLSL